MNTRIYMQTNKKNKRGGARPGAGPKIGSTNALKHPNKRRSIKKMITFTPKEWPKIQTLMEKRKHTEFNNFAREIILRIK